MQSLGESEVLSQSIHDALLATCMLLQLQATFINDGFPDYMIMGRGAGFLMQRMRRYKTIDDWQLRNLQAYVDRRVPLLDTDAVAFRRSRAAAIASSLTLLAPSCLKPKDNEFCTYMLNFSILLQQAQFERALHAH